MPEIRFVAPPLPHYIFSGEDAYGPGRTHPARRDIGVFDLLVVTKGCLHVAEEQSTFDVGAGRYLLLRPDRAHRSYKPCSSETHFYWVHLQTLGAWSETADSAEPHARTADDPFIRIHQFAFQLPRFGSIIQPDSVYSLLRQLNQLLDEPSALDRLKQQNLFQEMLLTLLQGAVLQPPANLVWRSRSMRPPIFANTTATRSPMRISRRRSTSTRTTFPAACAACSAARRCPI